MSNEQQNNTDALNAEEIKRLTELITASAASSGGGFILIGSNDECHFGSICGDESAIFESMTLWVNRSKENLQFFQKFAACFGLIRHMGDSGEGDFRAVNASDEALKIFNDCIGESVGIIEKLHIMQETVAEEIKATFQN